MQVIKPIGRNIRDLMLVCGVGPRLDAQDRHVLDESIFPYVLGQADLHRILFVGCHWYTWHYNRVFAAKDYWTLDINPARKRYGAKQHIIDSVANVADHFEPGSLDAVLLLGVIGWGLDDLAITDRAIRGIDRCLRPGGAFMLTWDDAPEHLPFPIGQIPSLAGFEPWVFPPFGATTYACEQQEPRHHFEFYRRPTNPYTSCSCVPT